VADNQRNILEEIRVERGLSPGVLAPGKCLPSRMGLSFEQKVTKITKRIHNVLLFLSVAGETERFLKYFSFHYVLGNKTCDSGEPTAGGATWRGNFRSKFCRRSCLDPFEYDLFISADRIRRAGKDSGAKFGTRTCPGFLSSNRGETAIKRSDFQGSGENE